MSAQVTGSELRTILSHLYDLSYLEDHPLAHVISRNVPKHKLLSHGECFRDTLIELIALLKPDTAIDASRPEHRAYVILSQRYVHRRPAFEVQEKLSIGDRQVRRELSRALDGLAVLLQVRLDLAEAIRTADSQASPNLGEPLIAEGNQLTPEPRTVQLLGVFDKVVNTLIHAGLLRSTLEHHVEPTELEVHTDPGILHLLLLNLLQSSAFTMEGNRQIVLRGQLREGKALVSIEDCARERRSLADAEDPTWYLARTLGVELTWAQDDLGSNSVRFVLPTHRHLHKVLIIDDEPVAIELYTSYLHGLNYQVVGLTWPQQALPMAVTMQPDVIILDVMMPAIDGWDLLQQLRHAVDLQNVPIVVCSVLDEYRLASALGAAMFLKKPIYREQMVAALEQVTNSL
ncbi:MAG: response regulator [Anaerolineae bacterium]